MTGAAFAITVGADRKNAIGKLCEVPVNGAGPAEALAAVLRSVPAVGDAWWSGHQFDGGHRQEAKWQRAAVAMVDVDWHVPGIKKPTPPTERASRFADAARDGDLPGNLFHLTPHGARVAFLLAETVTDPRHMKSAIRGACERVRGALAEIGLAEVNGTGYSVDSKATDLARFMFTPSAIVDGVKRSAEVIVMAAESYLPAELAAVAAAVEEPEPRASMATTKVITASDTTDDLTEAAKNWNTDHPIDLPKAGAGDCPICNGKGGYGELPKRPGKWFCWHETHPASVGHRTERGAWGDALDLVAHERGKSRVEVLRADGYLAPICGATTPNGKTCPATELHSDGKCQMHSQTDEAKAARKEFQKAKEKKTESADDEGMLPRFEHLTELGLARRLVARHGADLRYCFPWKKWLTYDGARWKADDTGEVDRRAKSTIAALYQEAANAATEEARKQIGKFALKSEKAGAVAAMVKLAESEIGIPVQPATLDTDPHLFNVLNGTLDLRTGKLRPHRREDMLTRLAPVDFDPDAACPTWGAFLDRIFENRTSLISFVQRFLGYCLTGAVVEHCMAVAFGTGRNGKSTLFELAARLMGDYAGTVPSELLLEKKGEVHPTERARLLGLRLAVCSETSADRKLDEAALKAITGGDKIPARRMREDWWDFEPTHKLVLYTNHKPVVRTTDEGTWSKLHLLPFAVTIPKAERDHALKDKLWAERAGILAWIVEGAVEWHRTGLGTCEDVDKATSEYRCDQDSIAAFITDRCELVADGRVPAKDLFAAYKTWCEGEGDRPLSQKGFGNRLTERGIVAKATKNARLRLGIILKGEG